MRACSEMHCTLSHDFIVSLFECYTLKFQTGRELTGTWDELRFFLHRIWLATTDRFALGSVAYIPRCCMSSTLASLPLWHRRCVGVAAHACQQNTLAKLSGTGLARLMTVVYDGAFCMKSRAKPRATCLRQAAGNCEPRCCRQPVDRSCVLVFGDVQLQ